MNTSQAILLKAAYDILCQLPPTALGCIDVYLAKELINALTLVSEIEDELGIFDEGERDETPDDWRDKKHDRGAV